MTFFSDADLRELGALIKRRRQALKLSARELARAAGVSDAHIIYIEKAQRRPSFHAIMNILHALGVSHEEMMREIRPARREANVEPAARGGPGGRVPVVTLVQAGAWKEVCDAFEPGDADEWIETDVRGPNVFALRVTGESMEPEFTEGEVIIVNPHVEAQPGDFVVVKNAGGEATFKQLKKYGPRYVLHPLNPRFADQEVRRGEFRIIGKVVKKEKRY
jgi:SOS-response transcriptional repressor LexA